MNKSSLNIVLVEPADSLNIGSVARAMSNFGFSNLHLVAPLNYQPEKARATACWGTEVLDHHRVHASLDQAIQEMQDVVGFSTREGKNLPVVQSLEGFAAEFKSRDARPTALLFGPEDTGLRNEHLSRCRCIVRIPTGRENPSLNLAQAVILALYEISRGSFSSAVSAEEYPTAAQFHTLNSMLDQLMISSEFLHAGSPHDLPDVVHGMFIRMQPRQREMQILLGVLSRILRQLSLKSS